MNITPFKRIFFYTLMLALYIIFIEYTFGSGEQEDISQYLKGSGSTFNLKSPGVKSVLSKRKRDEVSRENEHSILLLLDTKLKNKVEEVQKQVEEKIKLQIRLAATEAERHKSEELLVIEQAKLAAIESINSKRSEASAQLQNQSITFQNEAQSQLKALEDSKDKLSKSHQQSNAELEQSMKLLEESASKYTSNIEQSATSAIQDLDLCLEQRGLKTDWLLNMLENPLLIPMKDGDYIKEKCYIDVNNNAIIGVGIPCGWIVCTDSQYHAKISEERQGVEFTNKSESETSEIILRTQQKYPADYDSIHFTVIYDPSGLDSGAKPITPFACDYKEDITDIKFKEKSWTHSSKTPKKNGIEKTSCYQLDLSNFNQDFSVGIKISLNNNQKILIKQLLMYKSERPAQETCHFARRTFKDLKALFFDCYQTKTVDWSAPNYLCNYVPKSTELGNNPTSNITIYLFDEDWGFISPVTNPNYLNHTLLLQITEKATPKYALIKKNK